ncbi:hypothetical protein [Candidatus Izimaplasma sp. HR1]|jgi:hypothetical protein|uniref:hypothetical protein n=1 Tax=Candidatus Izimoplasma sp. HR1 TaxID=1541959 RepID=UPI00056DE588
MRTIKNWSLDKKNRFVNAFLIVIVSIYIIHSIFESVTLYNCIECSAPWHVALLFTTAIYAIPIIILIGLKIYLKIIRRV